MADKLSMSLDDLIKTDKSYAKMDIDGGNRGRRGRGRGGARGGGRGGRTDGPIKKGGSQAQGFNQQRAPRGGRSSRGGGQVSTSSRGGFKVGRGGQAGGVRRGGGNSGGFQSGGSRGGFQSGGRGGFRLQRGRSAYSGSSGPVVMQSNRGYQGANNSMGRPLGNTKGRQLLIKNIPIDITTRDLAEAFGSVGPVEYADLLKDSHGHPTGHAILVFSNGNDAKRAINEYNGGDLNGAKIQVLLD